VLLLHFETFTALPADFKQSFLDILFLILKGNVYNIIRFQCTGEGNGLIESFSLNPILINLLERSIPANVHTSTLKKIINLIGIVGTAGMAATDLKAYLNFLRTPSELSVALLQALKIMLGQDHITSDVRVKKASPAAIFDFGGSGAGLTTHLTTFPFSREYQFCTWFRVENFEGERHGYQQRAFNPTDLITQHVVTWQNAAQKGMDIFIDQKYLCVAISSTSKEPTFIRLMDCPLQRGVWYHITVRHAKPRLALFSSDELTIHIEDQLVFQDSVRFPSLGSASDMQFSFGTNFDGQMAPIYLMSESLPQNVVKMVAGLDAGRPVEGIDNGFNPVVVDLLPSITSSDRKMHPLLPKMTMVYHPSRCLRSHALDIHSGRHAKLGANTQTWMITNARDLLNSMGGLSCILPLFPRLLIENESYRTASVPSSQNSPYPAAVKALNSPYSPNNNGQMSFSFAEDSLAASAPPVSFTGLGDTLADLHEENMQGERDLDHATLRLLKQEREEYLGEGSVGLLLSIIAKCVVAHRLHQQELVAMGGIEMIEYALTCTPQEIMQGEGERCVFSLRELQKSASDLPTLERRITKSLLCNFAIWHRASFQLVSGLMSVILEAIKVRPALFVSLLGVKPVLDSLEFFTTVDENADYYLFDGNDVKPPLLGRGDSLEAEKEVLRLENLEHKDGEPKSEEHKAILPNPAAHALKVATKPVLKNGKIEGVGFTEGNDLTLTSPSGSMKRRGSRAGSSNSSTSGLLSLSTVHEDDEHFSDFSNPASSRSGVAFAGFADDVTTPTSVSRSSKLKIKRMKSFKLAMTEVIQDGVEEEEFAQERESAKSSSQGMKRNSFRIRKHSIDSIAEEENGDILAALNDSSHGVKSQNASHANSAFTIESSLESNVAIDERERASSTRSLEGSEYGAAMGFVPPPQSPEQRKHLRDCLEAMVVALVLHGGSDKEVSPILDYMVMCKDRVVLNEIAQILLYLIVERGSKFMHTIIMACNGPEEFASFVLLYLVHQPYEELRCSGVRILTHFYLRVDQIPPSVVNMTMKARRKGSIISRAIPTIGQNNSQGLQRLQLCGGLALLCEVISSHSKQSSELTYSALLELLLTKPGAKCQVTVQYTDLFELSGVQSAPVTSPAPQPSTFRGRLASLGNASGASANNFNTARGHAGRSAVVFAADYLSPDQVHDEGVDMMNSVALPIFFELLPKLPVRVQGQIYGDLLALLKHSEGNCHAFVSSASWQLCMFGLVSQLVALSENISGGKAVNTMSLLTELERWTGYVSVESPFLALNGKTKRRASTSVINPPGEVLRTWRNASGQMSNNNSYSYQSDTKPSTKHMSMSIPASVTAKLLEAANAINNAATITPTSTLSGQDDHDLWFAIGMKIYATLLLHAIEFKNGWKEIDRSISQSYESDVGYSVAQTVLSHVLNELTFTMRSKYKELQRLAKSSNSAENQEATDKIENFLCIILTTSQLALVDQRCAINGIKNFHLCKLRVHYFTEISKEFTASKEAPVGPEGIKLGTEYSGGEIPPSDMRHLLEKTEVQLASKLFCIGEPAAGLGVPNIQYDAEGARAKPLSEGPLAEEEEGDRYYKNLNFFHVWHDLNSEDTTTPEGSTNSANPTPFKSIEELLHPLERNHDLSKGKLVLVLQALRFFDIIFWPTDGTLIRNAEMMRFNKEDKGPAVDGGLGGASGKLGPDSKKRTASQTYPMSMYSAVMRMCLFILSELSPITHLAVMNVKRMRMLVNSVDKVPQYKTPTHDWLLAALLHTTLNLQRIALALEPVYEMLGLAECILVPTLGPWSDSYDEFDRMDPKDASVFDAVAENAELLMKLQRYFDSSPGRNLIRNVRASLLLLADAFEFHHDKLSASLEERTFRSLWVFVEHFKVDSIIQDPMRASSNDSHPTSEGAASRTSSIAVSHDVSGDIFESPPSNSPKLSKRGSSFSFGNARRYSSSADFRDDISETSEKYSESGSAQGDRPRSQTTTPVPLETGEDCFHGSDLLLVLRWLRFPYFRLNPFRSLGVIRAVDALDYLEGRSVNRFAKETQVMKKALEEQQDLAVKSVEEMTELKELSLAVHEMMSNRNDGRVAAVESADNLKLKNIAARWHDCLQTFEEDWSPWRVDEAISPHEAIGCARYELSKHRDSYLRRMATTKLAQPTYHKDAAYLEGKIKDQTNYEQGLDGIDLPAPVVSTANRGLPFKSRAANDKSGSATYTTTSSSWGDEDEDAIVEEASNANIIAAGISTLLYWNEKRPHWTYVFHWAPDEKLMFESEAMHIQLDQTVAGSVILTNKCLYFHSRKHMGGLAVTQQPFTDKCWHLDRIVEAYGRRYLLQNCAIELFFIDAVELFLAFKSMSELHRFFRFLRRQSLPLLVTPKSLNPKYAFANSPWTEMWRRRQISNFEYLMRLNVMAGRSFNDITQYPVFPWVISDFTSESIDLTNPHSFRRLDLPIGALNPTRLEEFLERFRSFDDDTVPKFMYGSHYSSAGVVLHYMVRQEPFTTLAINLQGGRFDCPDRVFFELNRTWDNCNQSMSDVKEMIPELFSCPEALLNTNNLPLGELQEGGKVGDVLLPPWAKDAYDFVRINRAALESDYVSDNLPAWIDLIFGYKQTGQAAVNAHNVFYYLTYENAINIENARTRCRERLQR